MSTTAIGQPAPDFDTASTAGGRQTLGDLKGRKLVLYFYPKDNTSGCTLEGQNFRDLHEQFEAANAVVLGVSRESIRSHDNFRAKESFPFHLLSDPDETLCKAYDVMKEKSMYGRKYMGVERSSFLIDEQGVLRQEWRKVKVKGHAEEVLEAARAL
ncbi:MAG: peroxiredoxin [Gammaproteobacteria bacterium]|nr:peroxiredoxin [Gammaproteobacteria bacterium]MCY4164930.1 peroxiredoxin [Gammaproteobacteria bacterium]MCY4255381.1 peroxiredoxin [Gammaproteobacteria bacterium]MCY4340557.1 peroxiredoxin [Gammaproteobacteria bacterium]